MKCVPFWLINPLKALENFQSIIPKKNQCIDEKLNGLTVFSILFCFILGVAGMKNFWLFGLIGISIIIIIKLVFFTGNYGKMSITEYVSNIHMDDLKTYDSSFESERDDIFPKLEDYTAAPIWAREEHYGEIRDNVRKATVRARSGTRFGGNVCDPESFLPAGHEHWDTKQYRDYSVNDY